MTSSSSVTADITVFVENHVGVAWVQSCPVPGECFGDSNLTNNYDVVTLELVGNPTPRFTVDTTGDGTDANPGDGTCATSAGDCTLRAAVEEANALAGADLISVPESTVPYRLGLAGAASAAIRITDDLEIVGPGRQPVLEAYEFVTVKDRMFWVPDGENVFVTLRNLIIRDGEANVSLGPPDGGLIYHGVGAGRLTLDNVTLEAGSAERGGAIFSGDELVVSRSYFLDNHASIDGGAVYSNSELDVRGAYAFRWLGSTFRDNTAGRHGGGVAVSESAEVASIDFATFEGNQAANVGGGLFLVTAPTSTSVQVRRSLFYDNEAQSGGGLGTVIGTVRVGNTTFSHNNASIAGGGINVSSGTVDLYNLTIVGNNADESSGISGEGGGIYVGPVASVSLQNTIAEDNFAQVEFMGGLPFPRGSVCFGTIESRGYNRLNPTLLDTECTITGDTTTVIDVNSRLGPLLPNGGPTLTHAFADDLSLALDAGDPSGCTWDTGTRSSTSTTISVVSSVRSMATSTAARVATSEPSSSRAATTTTTVTVEETSATTAATTPIRLNRTSMVTDSATCATTARPSPTRISSIRMATLSAIPATTVFSRSTRVRSIRIRTVWATSVTIALR